MRTPLFLFVRPDIRAPGIASAQNRNEGQEEAKHVLLWAGISVLTIFGETKRRTYSQLGVVNDETSTANPKIGDSHLFINGVEPKDWLIVTNNGLHTPEFEALPPGHYVSFGY